ncbi:Ras-related protein Rab-39B [Portunus trituberculatus]|uniref:Ras-related protein Rab-39B n=1 Tax=Portunus trituberculatus TaxID=210409 RepID=A0A5B7EQT2_PORTR|nr:Ras-related protein Rab-39B [Portunus trituberculatus]
MVEPIFDYQFRLILIGDSTVGKSSLLKYFTDGKFFEVGGGGCDGGLCFQISDPTVGVDFFARLIEVSDGTRIKLQLWDTAGQERFRSITRTYYRNSVGALVVFDVCNKKSLEHVPMWIMEAKRHIEPHKAVFILVGTKEKEVGFIENGKPSYPPSSTHPHYLLSNRSIAFSASVRTGPLTLVLLLTGFWCSMSTLSSDGPTVDPSPPPAYTQDLQGQGLQQADKLCFSEPPQSLCEYAQSFFKRQPPLTPSIPSPHMHCQ